MRRSTRLIAAVATASALLLSACGSSDSAPRNRNVAIAQPGEGLNIAVHRIKQGNGNMENSKNYGYGSFKNLTKYYEDRDPCEGANKTVPNIDADWAREVIENCDSEYVLINYTGFITVPGTPGEKTEVTFQNRSDDGFWMEIDGRTVIDNWDLQPCGGRTATVTLVAGQKLRFNSWFFEHDDWACNTLYWTLPGQGMTVVPPSAFSLTEKGGEGSDDDDSDSDSDGSSPSSSMPTENVFEQETTTTSSQPSVKGEDEGEGSTSSTAVPADGDTSSTTEPAVEKKIIIEDTTPITVPSGTTQLECDTTCVESIRTTLGVTGDVYATVAGERVLLDGKTAIPTNGAEVVFSDGGDKEITVALEAEQVAEDAEDVAPSFDGSSGDGSSFPWIIIIIAIAILAGGGYVASTRKKKSVS